MLTSIDRNHISKSLMKKFQVQFVIFNEKSVINGWKSAKDFPKMIFWIFINEDLQIGTDKDVADDTYLLLMDDLPNINERD